MRKHSDLFPLALGGAGFALFAILQNAYQNALQAWVLDWLKQHGYQDQWALVVSSLLPLVPNIGLASGVIWLIYRYVKKDFEKNFETGGDYRALQVQQDATAAIREHTMELARQRESAELPPMIKNIIDSQNRRERIAMGLEPDPDKAALAIKINEYSAYDGGAEQQGDRGVHVFLAELTGGDRALTGCQIHLDNGRGHSWVIGKPFNLRPGERKVVPLIRYRKSENSQQCRAFVYMLRDDGEKVMEGAAVILGPDRYTFKVLSQEAKPVTVEAQLGKHPKSESDWILEEVPHAPKT